MMATQLLEIARLEEVGKFIQIGMVYSYPKHSSLPFKEEDFWEGYLEETNSPNGIAKKALFIMAQEY